jgi:hypothetical protein
MAKYEEFLLGLKSDRTGNEVWDQGVPGFLKQNSLGMKRNLRLNSHVDWRLEFMLFQAKYTVTQFNWVCGVVKRMAKAEADTERLKNISQTKTRVTRLTRE